MKIVKNITVKKAEGRNPLPPPATRLWWNEIQAILRSWAYDAAPEGGSYLKCDAKVVFEDDSEYLCRFDLTWIGRNTNGETLQYQVERQLGC